MNNEQFRKLLLANAAKSKSDGDKRNGAPATSSTPALGSRLKSNIPMTPRSAAGGVRNDFARQLAERQHQAFEKAQKKHKTSLPKGSKFAQGYVDRAKTRQDQDDEDDRAARLEALDESLKNEEIDKATYDRLRSEIAGGDLSSTHLVKGLDFKLLERIRKGEDVYGGGGDGDESKASADAGEEAQAELEEDPDDVLEKLESAEVHAITREKVQKKGQLATTTLNTGQKRSRNQILAEMKAARDAAKAKAESSLGPKFKKIGAKKTPGTRIERDSKGREVMIIIDEDGYEKRKIRKIEPKPWEEQEKETAAFTSGNVLGMEVPEFYKKQLAEQAEREAAEEQKEITIFDDAGSDYDPLAGLEDGSDNDSSAEEGEAKEAVAGQGPASTATAALPDEGAKPSATLMGPPPKPDAASSPARNYFKDSKTALTSAESYKGPSLNDPTLLAALQKAKAISAAEKSEEEQKAAEREQRLKKKLLESSRDDDDLDLGFGSSRAEDQADAEDAKVKLSTWRGGHDDDDDDDDGEDGGGRGDKSKRKRGSKKRKGDKSSFEEVMKVVERNKKT
ncbi:hypothetical protein B0T26DRAFT_745455 [Lasiosphaeria miniovina]|uniref:RED-like N-terminal domain-containing protein n=1 Tax=Lasiosphaeria miniovina TaxID=1954250 RepID=A0AA40EB28_9PEZI|nr:uncharacterized protein B0T26DRAFT_745455 [Lasiosphaeria miniovina]KAK0733415.1 hypothetical protein B0T26DRAFT_745455 [Lasiosphaeria miniovina]